MVTIGLSSMLKALRADDFWGTQIQVFPPILPEEPFMLSGPARGPGVHRGAFISLMLFGVFTLFFKYSSLGIAMRATAFDQQAAQSMGIGIKPSSPCPGASRPWSRASAASSSATSTASTPSSGTWAEGLSGGDPGRAGQPARRGPGRADHRHAGKHLRRAAKDLFNLGGFKEVASFVDPGDHPHDQAARTVRNQGD
jgi:branched-chain amino acid transport system permease protein